MALSGSKAKTNISRDGITWTDISDATYGLDGIDLSEEESTVEVGGGGRRMGMDVTGYVQASASMTVDENERSGPVLHMYGGGTLHVRYRREGDGDGMPQAIFSGPCSVSHEWGERDKRRYTVEVMVNGEINRAEQ